MISRHYIVVLVENKTGVLNRVSSLLRKRNFNIESLTVSTTEKEGVSRITMVFDGEKTNTEQVIKQLDKLINVIAVWDATKEPLILQETLLIKVCATRKERGEILEFVEAFQAKIHAAYKKTLILGLTGPADRIDDFITIMKDFGIVEMVRTGEVAMNKAE